MIVSFRSKALRRFWEDDERGGLRPDLIERIDDLLELIDLAETPEDTNAPGSQFHGLQGRPKRYALSVNKNWRITFGWDGLNAIDVDLVDYH